MSAARTAKEYDRAAKNTRNEMLSLSYKIAFDSLTDQQQQLCIKYMPETVREAGAKHLLSKTFQGKRPESWFKFKPAIEIGDFEVYFPSQPDIEREGPNRLKATVRNDKESKLYMFAHLDLGKVGESFTEVQIENLIAAARKAITGNGDVAFSHPIVVHGGFGNHFQVESMKSGKAVTIEDKCYYVNGRLTTIIFQGPANQEHLEQDWFANSIKLN